MRVRGELGLGGSRVAVAGEEFLGVAWNAHATHMFGIVPVKVHTGKFGTL